MENESYFPTPLLSRQVTPASSACPLQKSTIPMPPVLTGQSISRSSFPRQSKSSSQMGPDPCPKKALGCAVAPEWIITHDRFGSVYPTGIPTCRCIPKLSAGHISIKCRPEPITDGSPSLIPTKFYSSFKFCVPTTQP